jgi:glycosyltransferase involved in cell wall biosynthesis
VRIKVLGLVADLHFGGGENRILNIARSIDNRLFDYELACLYLPLPTMNAACGDMRPEFASAGINVIDLKLSRPGSGRGGSLLRSARTGGTLLRSAKMLARYIASEKVDVLDAHLEGALFPAMAAARLAGKPATITLYQAEPFEHKPLLRPFRRLALRQAAAIITDSSKRARDIETFIGRRVPPVDVIPNGVRLNPPARNRKDVLAELLLPDDTKLIVGQVSGLTDFKGQRTLLEAARHVLTHRSDVRFIIVGFPRSGLSYLESLENHARSLGIADFVRIHSYPRHIADIWSIIDVHVHASEWDSLPNAIIEGMSLGKPAVVTSVGGIPDLVKHERTGLVVQPGDAKALAVAILRLVEDPVFAIALGAGAKRRYLECCTPECMIQLVEKRWSALHHGYSVDTSRMPRAESK